MSALAEHGGDTSSSEETEISLAAIDGYGRLLQAVGQRVRTHATKDGGLICEYRPSRARPIMWRVLPDGEILPDTRYSYLRREFVTVKLPAGVSSGAIPYRRRGSEERR